jgi:hypothetical protein
LGLGSGALGFLLWEVVQQEDEIQGFFAALRMTSERCDDGWEMMRGLEGA